jgi:hypothetical protein
VARIRIFIGLSLFLFLALAITACHPEPVVPQDARIYILNPAAESATTGNSITIQTFVDRFNLVNKAGKTKEPGEGHIIYYRDVTPPLEPGKSALTADGTYVISIENSYTWSGLQPGTHTFWVQLVNNDNTVLQPAKAVRVYVTVR